MVAGSKVGAAAAFVCLSLIDVQAEPPQLAPRPVAAIRTDGAAHFVPTRRGPAPVDLPAIRDHLLTQLKRAADAGYVVLRDSSLEKVSTSSAAVHEPASKLLAPKNAAVRARSRPARRGIRIRGAPDDAPPLPVDVAGDAGGLAGSNASLEDRPAALCIEEELLSLERESDTTEPARNARPTLVGEFDRPLRGKVLAEARKNLRRGLAIEAQLILDSFGETGPDADALRLMASVLGRAHPRSGWDFRGVDCGPRFRLWRAVERAGAGEFASDSIAGEGVRDALLVQPRGVRGRMATRLGRAAVRAGATATAHWLHDLASRDRDEADSAWFRLFTAELAHEDGDGDVALRVLASTHDGTREPSARALLLMARIALEKQDGTVRGTLRLREDLGAAARTWRGDRLGGELLTAEARLVAAASGVAEAVSLLHHGASVGLIGSAAFDQAVASLASTPARGRAGAPLAVLYHARPERFLGALEDRSFRAALARSYASVGIPRLAVPLLTASDLADPELVAELFRAAVEAGDRRTAQKLRPRLTAGKGERLLPDTLENAQAANQAVAHELQVREDVAEPEPDRSPRAGEPAAVGAVEAAAATAFTALNDGRADIPPRALGVLKRRKPRLAAALVALASAPASGGPEPGSIAYLERLDQELSAIAGLLHDG